ncbi:MAG: hypothetical protein Ct9H300mP13_1810 [Gammaproteobacteria bacterium]|nr:MAG: hypothetical protein Ct9H300mP13_1810 [Gammaproteobacteria bacterium]
MTLSGLDVIFNPNPMTEQSRHFGSRLLFGLDGALLVTLGDHGQRSWAQDRTVYPGSVIRIWPTGDPHDNPFVGVPRGAGVISYGHRNPQGLVINPRANGSCGCMSRAAGRGRAQSSEGWRELWVAGDQLWARVLVLGRVGEGTKNLDSHSQSTTGCHPLHPLV